MKNIQQTANVAQNDLALHAIINSSNYANVVGQVFVVQMWWAVWGGFKKKPQVQASFNQPAQKWPAFWLFRTKSFEILY